MCAASAACFTGDAVNCWVRPTGRSGCETTRAIWCRARISASRVGTAKRGVPHNTNFTFLPSAFALHLADFAQYQIALERAHAEDEEHPVEMVNLMLKCA